VVPRVRTATLIPSITVERKRLHERTGNQHSHNKPPSGFFKSNSGTGDRLFLGDPSRPRRNLNLQGEYQASAARFLDAFALVYIFARVGTFSGDSQL
jgi:hypothetical protein